MASPRRRSFQEEQEVQDTVRELNKLDRVLTDLSVSRAESTVLTPSDKAEDLAASPCTPRGPPNDTAEEQSVAPSTVQQEDNAEDQTLASSTSQPPDNAEDQTVASSTSQLPDN